MLIISASKNIFNLKLKCNNVDKKVKRVWINQITNVTEWLQPIKKDSIVYYPFDSFFFSWKVDFVWLLTHAWIYELLFKNKNIPLLTHTVYNAGYESFTGQWMFYFKMSTGYTVTYYYSYCKKIQNCLNRNENVANTTDFLDKKIIGINKELHYVMM